jgi:methylated-DNA-[protein]-cysteine S-methyltransferase
MVHHTIFPTPFGELAVLWEGEPGPRVFGILIPLPERPVPSRLAGRADVTPSNHPLVDDLCDQIARYLSGEAIEPPIDLLDRSRCTLFQWQVLMAEKAIPRGQVRTYAQVAAAAGHPGAARAAGNALATNLYPIVIPCHRAVRADGSLGGYQGGAEMKRALLEMEGVEFDERGRVALVL